MRSKAVLMALAMAGLAMSATYPSSPSPQEFEPVINEEDRKRKYKDVLTKKGVQEFNIDGKIILARTYKNALRKARKI